MTAQASDIIHYKEEKYDLAGVSGEGLFEPQKIGIEPDMIDTGCYRGYVCTYTIIDNELRLTHLYIGLSDEDERKIDVENGLTIFGIKPNKFIESGYEIDFDGESRYEEWESGYFECRGLNVKMDFTGCLLIGRELTDDYDPMMPSPLITEYRFVHELDFNKGGLVDSRDMTSEIEAIREGSNKEPKESIRSRFKGEYKWI